MAAKYHPVMRKDSMKYTWKIENYSQFKSKVVCSDTFRAGGYKWRIHVLSEKKTLTDCLTANMHFADGNPVHGGWSVTPEMSLTIVHPLNAALSKRIRFSDNLRSENAYGTSKYLCSVESLVHEGFLVDDILIIEAELCIVEPDRNLVVKLYDTLAEETNNFVSSGFYSFRGSTLREISTRIPRTKEELLRIQGIWKEDVREYGDRLLQTIEATIRDFYEKEGSGDRGYVIGDSYSPESRGRLVLKNSDSPPSNKVDRTSTVTSPCSANVQLASKNLIAKLSTMARIHVSASDTGHGSAALQQQRGKLAEFFDMPLESIYEANQFANAQEVVLQIFELATDPFEKTLLKNLLSHLLELRSSIPEYVSTIESSREVRSSTEQTVKELEGSLHQKQKQLTFLESEICRIEEEKMKAKAGIQLLVAREEELGREKNSNVAELEVANREASRELREREELEQALENGMIAEEKLAQFNASWKLFRAKLGL